MPSNEHSVKINIPEVKLLPCEAVVHDVSLFADEDEENKIAIRCLNTKKNIVSGSSKNETEVVKSDNGARMSLSDDPNEKNINNVLQTNIATSEEDTLMRRRFNTDTLERCLVAQARPPREKPPWSLLENY